MHDARLYDIFLSCFGLHASLRWGLTQSAKPLEIPGACAIYAHVLGLPQPMLMVLNAILLHGRAQASH